MGFKTFLISIIKSLIVLLLATLIFSTVTLDFPNLIKGVFGDIFAYASPDAQKQVVSKLAESCSSLDKIENEAQVEETCQQIESGEIARACNQFNQKSFLLPDFSKIGVLCKDYKSGKINDKEFFFNVISGAIPNQMQMPNIGFLEKYNQAINYLNNHKPLYFIILTIFIILLYLLIMDVKSFILNLTGISFSIGILIMLPYFAIMLYEKFVGFDTTSILNSIIGNLTGFEPKAILSVALLMFLRTYNSFIITIGIIFLTIGIVGKVCGFVLRRKIMKKEELKVKIKKKKK